MRIKAISLWQPWASLISVGAKRYETRSWATSYRGPLLICAALKRLNPLDFPKDFEQAVWQKLSKSDDGYNYPLWLPFGKAVAIVNLTDCIQTELFKRGHKDFLRESLFGDFSSGRYAWELENIRAIKPFPVKGRQGLFEVELPNIREVTL